MGPAGFEPAISSALGLARRQPHDQASILVQAIHRTMRKHWFGSGRRPHTHSKGSKLCSIYVLEGGALIAAFLTQGQVDTHPFMRDDLVIERLAHGRSASFIDRRIVRYESSSGDLL